MTPPPPKTAPNTASQAQPHGGLLRALGPGLLFAGAAVGVSHVVQSTRAGALYGLALVPAMLAVHALKYPSLSAGARYTSATGRTLLDGYRAMGRLPLALAAAVLIATAVTIQAVIANVTAAVAHAALAVDTAAWPTWRTALALQLIAGAIVAFGGFRWLDRVMKLLMATLAVTTLAAAASVLPRLDLSTLALANPDIATAAGLGFLLAFAGWMPAPIDVAIWNSLWTYEKNKQLGAAPPPRLVTAEFLVGYAQCIVLAAAFIVLGAALIHDRGQPPAAGAAIAVQLLDSYADALTPAVRPLVAVCAVAVMFSTLLASTDALPRTAAGLTEPHRTDPATGRPAERRHVAPTYGPFLLAALAALVAAATLTVALGTRGEGDTFRRLVDVATIASFLATPLLAFFNHRLMHSPDVPAASRPPKWETALSWLAIAVFTAFAATYLTLRLT